MPERPRRCQLPTRIFFFSQPQRIDAQRPRPRRRGTRLDTEASRHHKLIPGWTPSSTGPKPDDKHRHDRQSRTSLPRTPRRPKPVTFTQIAATQRNSAAPPSTATRPCAPHRGTPTKTIHKRRATLTDGHRHRGVTHRPRSLARPRCAATRTTPKKSSKRSQFMTKPLTGQHGNHTTRRLMLRQTPSPSRSSPVSSRDRHPRWRPPAPKPRRHIAFLHYFQSRPLHAH